MSIAGEHGGGPHRAKLVHVQRQTGGEEDGDGGHGGAQLSEDGCPHLGGQAEAVEQPWAYDEEVLIEMEKYKFLLMVAFTLELMMR